MPSEDVIKLVPKRTTPRWRPIGVVVGGVLVHLSLGTLYTFGNLNPYLTSYLRHSGTAPDLTYTECSWIFALGPMGIGASMFFSGILERKLGPQLTSLFGSWLMSLGVFLTYFSVKQSFGLTLVTYGLMFGVGSGLSYAIPLSCAMKWMPDKKGLVSGFIVAGFGAGAFIFNQVQTAYINPHNLEPSCPSGSETYFCDKSLLDKVPSTFLILGGCYAVMQLVGSVLIVNPPSEEERYEEPEGIKESEIDEPYEPLPNSDPIARIRDDSINIFHTSTSARAKGMKVQDVFDIGPKQVLRSLHFWVLFFLYLFSGQGMIFVSSLYKAYGQTFIKDDTFLSVVGTLAAIFNGGGRIFWGKMADKYSFRLAFVVLNGIFACLMFTFHITHLGGKAPFTIWVCLLFGTFSGIFSLFPTATAKCFGRRYMTMNYGLLAISMIPTAVIGTGVSQSLMSVIGWSNLFFVVAGCSISCLVLTIVAFNARDRNGREI